MVAATVDLIHAFRASGMPVLWTNWGLTEFDSEWHDISIWEVMKLMSLSYFSAEYAACVYQRIHQLL